MSYNVSPRLLEVEAHAKSQGSFQNSRRTFYSSRLNGKASSSRPINDCITSRTQTSDLRSHPIATLSPRGEIGRAAHSKMDLPTSELGCTRWNELSAEGSERKWWEVEVEQLYDTVWAASGSEHSDRSSTSSTVSESETSDYPLTPPPTTPTFFPQSHTTCECEESPNPSPTFYPTSYSLVLPTSYKLGSPYYHTQYPSSNGMEYYPYQPVAELPAYYPSPPLSDFLPTVSPIPEQFEFPDPDPLGWRESVRSSPRSRMGARVMEAIPALKAYFGDSSTTAEDTDEEDICQAMDGIPPTLLTPGLINNAAITIKLEEPEEANSSPFRFEPLSESSDSTLPHVKLPSISQLSLPSHSESSTNTSFAAPPLIPYFDILLAQSLPPAVQPQPQQEQNITNEQFYDTVSEMLAESREASTFTPSPPEEIFEDDKVDVAMVDKIAGEEDDTRVFGEYEAKEELVDSNGQSIDFSPHLTATCFAPSPSSSALICYRRNHLSFTLSLKLLPTRYFLSLTGTSRRLIKSLELELTAESKRGNKIEILQMGSDRSLQKAKEVSVASIDLTRGQKSKEGKGESLSERESEMEILEFKRLQFRRATANNPSGGNDPDYYILTATLFALVQLESKSSSSKKSERIEIGSFTSRRIVVRGRSPKDFQEKDRVKSKEKEKEKGKKVVGRRSGGRKRKTTANSAVGKEPEESDDDHEENEEVQEVARKRARYGRN